MTGVREPGMLRIAVVHRGFEQLGGAERYLLELAAAYAEAGHAVTLLSITPAPPGPWVVELLPTPGPSRWWTGQSAFAKVFRHLMDAWPWRFALARRVEAGRFDVVHLHNWQLVGAGAVRRATRRVPVVHTVHDFALVDPTTTLDSHRWSPTKRAVLAARSRLLARRFGQVHLHWPSARTRKLATDAEPRLRRPRSWVIPLSSRSTEEMRELAAGDAGTFLFLGRLEAHKGLVNLLDAWRDARPPAGRLLIAGDGPLRAPVEEAAAVAGSGISYLGQVDGARKLEAMAAAGWLVFPSTWHENFSLACIEALTAGRPILASRVARPPMASSDSVVVFDGARELATALLRCATVTGPEYGRRATSARSDGAGLGWGVHVAAMLELLASTVAEGASRARLG